jgi:hypothetical protein
MLSVHAYCEKKNSLKNAQRTHILYTQLDILLKKKAWKMLSVRTYCTHKLHARYTVLC